jgi:hypothetical protein
MIGGSEGFGNEGQSLPGMFGSSLSPKITSLLHAFLLSALFRYHVVGLDHPKTSLARPAGFSFVAHLGMLF